MEWEHTETDRDSGRQLRKRFSVPVLVDPAKPGNSQVPPNRDGEYVVAYAGSEERGDIVFTGEPTVDMEPLDEEAEEISRRLASKWKHPIESLQAQGGLGEVLLQDLQKQLESAIRGAAQAVAQPSTSLAGVSTEAFAALQAQVALLAQQNLDLQARLAGAEQPVADEEPLEPELPIVEAAPAPSLERRA